MPFYLAKHPNPEAQIATIWDIDDRLAVRVDAVQKATVLSPFPNIVLEGLPGFTFHLLELAPGEFYPRMARPLSSDIRQRPGICPQTDTMLVEMARGQLVALREQLERVFRTVHPTDSNLGAYGHDIRNILILASTEVEAHWKGILKANGTRGETTNDYVKLLPAMKLDDYSIFLPFYPWLNPVLPFAGWLSSRPRKAFLGITRTTPLSTIERQIFIRLLWVTQSKLSARSR